MLILLDFPKIVLSYKSTLLLPFKSPLFCLIIINQKTIQKQFPPMSTTTAKKTYKTYCFEHKSSMLYFYYIPNHPMNAKQYKFQLGRAKIFTEDGRLLTCQIFSNTHLNPYNDWNQQFFAKLFYAMSTFQVERGTDQNDDTLSLVVKDNLGFLKEEGSNFLNAKLTDELGFDYTNQFWHTFKSYNLERIKNIETMEQENRSLMRKADEELVKLVELQSKKQAEKDRLKGQLSALLREKQNKLKQFNESFKFVGMESEMEVPMEIQGQKETMSITGSLFQDSQEFVFPN